jgi:hypothetical protein
MALKVKSGENGHLARANGAIGGPYCSPTWPSVFGRRYEPLAGRGGGFGGRSCTSAHTRRVGRFFHTSALGKRAVPRPSGTVSEGYARGVWVSSPVPGRARGGKAVAFHNPQASQSGQEENHSCARGQVVIARPPVLTPPMTLSAPSCESKGRFTTSMNVICVGIRSGGLPKRRYCVAIDYKGDLLRHREKSGCWLLRGCLGPRPGG